MKFNNFSTLARSQNDSANDGVADDAPKIRIVHKTFKIATWNKGGHWSSKLKNKRIELEKLLVDKDLDVLVIPESNTIKGDQLSIPGYELIQGNEDPNRICLFVKIKFNAKVIKIGTDTPFIHIKLYKNLEEIDVIGVYREYKKFGQPPRNNAEQRMYWNRYLVYMNSIVVNKLVWLGDFNLDWTQRGENNYDKKLLLDELSNTSYLHRLRQNVTTTTRNVEKSKTLIEYIMKRVPVIII